VSIGSASHLPDRKGSGTTTCTVALNPASLQGRAPVRHMFYSSGSCLLAGEGSEAPHILQLRILPSYRGGLRRATYPMALDPASLPGGLRCRHRMSCGFLWTVGLRYIKNGLASLPMQLGSRVSKASVHVPYAPDARANMGLQDVRTSSVIITCKMCRHDSYSASTVPHQLCLSLVEHYYSARRPDRIAWQDDKTGRTTRW
jgi:hypothetical protein